MSDDYIGPSLQLPEQAESLHAVDWQAFGEALVNVFRQIGETLSEVITSAVPIIAQSMEAFRDAYEDATRDNAYHPQGSVIRSTGFGLPDNTPAPDQKLIEPPYTVMHEGKAAFSNFGTIEQIKARLQAARGQND